MGYKKAKWVDCCNHDTHEQGIKLQIKTSEGSVTADRTCMGSRNLQSNTPSPKLIFLCYDPYSLPYSLWWPINDQSHSHCGEYNEGISRCVSMTERQRSLSIKIGGLRCTVWILEGDPRCPY
jgi:hypothetical protein